MAFIDQQGIYFCNRCVARYCGLHWQTYHRHGLSLSDHADTHGFESYHGEDEICEWCQKEKA